MSDLISRQDAVDACGDMCACVDDCICEIKKVPTAITDNWLSQNRDKILQAGLEGKEVDLRIGGRLFKIREVAQ